MLVFPIELESGKGFVLTQQITSIMPHQTRKDRSVIFTDSIPNGLDIIGKAGELAEQWNQQLMDIEHGIEFGEEE